MFLHAYLDLCFALQLQQLQAAVHAMAWAAVFALDADLAQDGSCLALHVML
jgi:hypothetical protein